MFNFNPYYNYYSNPPKYYSYYNNPAFFSNYRPYNNINRIKSNIYNFTTKKLNTYNNDDEITENDTTNNLEENKEIITETKENDKNKEKETVRFSIGDFSLTDRGINIFGLHLNFDDIIIILLIIFLFFETDCDLSLIIILGLMLFNINISTIKNIF